MFSSIQKTTAFKSVSFLEIIIAYGQYPINIVGTGNRTIQLLPQKFPSSSTPANLFTLTHHKGEQTSNKLVGLLVRRNNR